MSQNYFNTLNLRQKLAQLGCCGKLMDRSEFADGCNFLKGKKVVIVGCGAQGLNQGLNLRDSGLDVSYALREAAIQEKRASFKRATENGFKVGTYEGTHPDCRSGDQPDSGQAARERRQRRAAPDEERRRAGLLPRLQHSRAGHAGAQGHHRRDGRPEGPGYRGPRGVPPRLRHPDAAGRPP